MIFTLVTAVQEKLNEIVDMMKNRIEEEKRRKEKEAEEAEKVGKLYTIVISQTRRRRRGTAATVCSVQVAFQGTVVTIENFLAWKATFDLEMTELRRRKQKEEEQGSKSKLTGEKWHLISVGLWTI